MGEELGPAAAYSAQVAAWLQWAAQEFQLFSDSVTEFIHTFKVRYCTAVRRESRRARGHFLPR